jgi:hypothetical protein
MPLACSRGRGCVLAKVSAQGLGYGHNPMLRRTICSQPRPFDRRASPQTARWWVTPSMPRGGLRHSRRVCALDGHRPRCSRRAIHRSVGEPAEGSLTLNAQSCAREPSGDRPQPFTPRRPLVLAASRQRGSPSYIRCATFRPPRQCGVRCVRSSASPPSKHAAEPSKNHWQCWGGRGGALMNPPLIGQATKLRS